jgi:precorrin-6Y C5,15-methyltransferase (decarboxylating)
MGLPLAGQLPDASVYVGGRRHLELAGIKDGVVIGGDLAPVLDAVAAAPGTVCVLASGDPGFFGIVRALAERFGGERLEVHPAPSSVSLAFARIGLPWDDATVVSAHGRPLADAAWAAAASADGNKTAVLVSPDNPPEALGKELLSLGQGPVKVVVASRLGLEGEAVVHTDLPGLAAGTWDPLSVVIILKTGAGSGIGPRPVLQWGRNEQAFEHRAGMVTKSEVRAVALSKLSLPATGVLWDVGAGSGSVAIEASLLSPTLSVYAVEQDGAAVQQIDTNASRLGASITVVHGAAPAALAGLPDPDRAFVGGGGLDVLDAVISRLRPGGQVAATFAAMDRAAAAADRLGQLVQVATGRGARLPDGGWRLAAENPVFVVWGPWGPTA